MKVFCSGSCRLLNAMVSSDIMQVIHNLDEVHFHGTNFMGKFHDTKSHIQFIRYIKGEVDLDEDIRKRFFTCYNMDKWQGIRYIEPLNTIYDKIRRLKEQIDICDAYIFEVCSLKEYKYKGGYCQFEQIEMNDVSDYDICIQTKEELIQDLYTIVGFFPGKRVVFQCHFRPNVIYNDDCKALRNREIIYNTIYEFCKLNSNCYLYDPSVLIREDHTLYDGDTHFTQKGYRYSFNHICKLLDYS